MCKPHQTNGKRPLNIDMLTASNDCSVCACNSTIPHSMHFGAQDSSSCSFELWHFSTKFIVQKRTWFVDFLSSPSQFVPRAASDSKKLEYFLSKYDKIIKMQIIISIAHSTHAQAHTSTTYFDCFLRFYSIFLTD